MTGIQKENMQQTKVELTPEGPDTDKTQIANKLEDKMKHIFVEAALRSEKIKLALIKKPTLTEAEIKA